MGIREDIQAIRDKDPAAKTNAEVFLTYPGLHAVAAHRLSHYFYKKKRYFFARCHSQLWRFITGIEIHPGAVLGRRIFIDHGMGVVIGETAIIEDDVTLFHGVTLGGTGTHTGKRHPTVKRGAFISAHAQILGPITIGVEAKIGAAAVVLKDVPDYATAVGVPARIVQNKDKGEKKTNYVNL
ncbi:serine O-acetyltransferase EpsC [Vagococcus vulneris]|uniref:Serine acetyltransferase n=1 Tax=Vagococcus vulneris TaxID=1977869 RepID=A0A430A0K8_9ENTE|nr:serine O-acetyltransferase EpsC [Vagococcus vulneris]RST99854.1 serine O-acetyltransferase [Vagococcus vulneris]